MPDWDDSDTETFGRTTTLAPNAESHSPRWEGVARWLLQPQRDSNPCRHLERVVS